MVQQADAPALVWHTFAGGVAAASDKHGYQAVTSHGLYDISPISHANDVERHMGYSVYFLNDRGRLPGPLWQRLSHKLIDLQKAKQLCRDHNLQSSRDRLTTYKHDSQRLK